MEYGGYGRGGPGGRGGRGGGRGHRDRSFSPPPQRRSPDYGRYGPSHDRGGPPGRRDRDPYRDEYRGRPGDRDGPDDRRRPYGRDHGRSGYGYGRDGSRDRDRYDGGGYGDRGGGESPPYDYEGRGGSRGASPGGEEAGKPLSKTMFIKRHIDEDADDAEIDKRYTDYLATFYKSRNKAAFERQKHEDAFKRKYDPFMFKEEVAQRSKTAQTTAVTFGRSMAEGKYDWTVEGKQQLLLPSEFKKACAAKTPCPVISWLPEVISCCWKVALQLIIKMDAEKSVRQDFFEWIEAAKEAQGTKAPVPAKAGDGGAGGAGDAEPAEGEEPPAAEDAMDAEDDGAAEAAAQPADAELLSGDAIEGDELATKTGQLDVMLEFLWQVHGVDFYSGGGGELSVGLYRSVKERLMRTPPDVEFRAVRIQKPQSGNLVDDKRREQVIEEFHHNVSKPWIERLKRVDADTQKALDLDATTSYKCQLCDKKFKGSEYLTKHMHNKHGADIDAFRAEEREKARDELFFENFETQIKFEQPAAEPGAPRGRPPPDGGMPGMPPMPPMGPMGPGMPMVPPMMMNPMMMQMMATQMNMMMGGGGPAMMMGGPGRGMGGPGMPPMMGGRGGGGGRGMGPGPPGRRGGRGREYFDFDAPANQREQLNYGDI